MGAERRIRKGYWKPLTLVGILVLEAVDQCHDRARLVDMNSGTDVATDSGVRL